MLRERYSNGEDTEAWPAFLFGSWLDEFYGWRGATPWTRRLRCSPAGAACCHGSPGSGQTSIRLEAALQQV